jgi:hypothetical protein
MWPKRKGQETSAQRVRAEQALARLKLADPDTYRAELTVMHSEHSAAGENVKLSGVHAQAGADELSKAAFALPGPGLVPRVIETSAGYSVVMLEQIIPASEAKFEDHQAAIREQLITEGRRARVEALISELKSRTEVSYHEDAIARAFADESLGNPR